MKTKTKKLLTVIKYSCDFVWYLTILLTIGAIILMAIGKLDSDSKKTFFTQVEYGGELKEEYKTFWGEEAVFTPSEGRLEIQLSDKHAEPFSLLTSAFIRWTIFIFIVYQCRRFFTAIVRESPFSPLAVRSLRLISIAMVGMNLAYWFHKYFALNEIVSQVAGMTNVRNILFPNDFYYLMAALLVYILSEIFKHGYEIQEENKTFV